MEFYRQSCEIGPFINAYKKVQPTISAVRLTAYYLSDLPNVCLKDKALALYHMKRGWHTAMGIN